MTILVTGAGGQLGYTISSTLESLHRVVALDRGELDLVRSAAVFDAVHDLEPDVIINCAAYTNVDGAEDDPSTAFNVNAFGVRTLAQAARDVDATLVHYSTDFVFDGEADSPYTEEDATNPQSAYAMSKLLGEWFAQDAHSYILRVCLGVGVPIQKAAASTGWLMLFWRDGQFMLSLTARFRRAMLVT